MCDETQEYPLTKGEENGIMGYVIILLYKKEINMKKVKEADPRLGVVGGQAVLEGVMMKSESDCSIAVRTPEGDIKIENTVFVSLRKKHKFFDIPIIRGIVSFIEQMKLSMGMLTKSADMQGIDMSAPETKFEKWLLDKLGDKLMSVITAIGMVLGVMLGVGLFLMLPTFAAKGLDFMTGGFIGRFALLRSLVEGLIRMGIFVGYIALTSLMPDIRRTYEFHGAEHKSIACFESGLELTPENAAKCTRFHPRCGTSFIFVMLILSIVINSFLSWDNVWLRFGSKILILPLIVGLGFEFIRYAGRHDNVFTRVLSSPGLWMQRITTREPDATQLEVAIAALLNAIPVELGGVEREGRAPREEKSEEKSEDSAEGGEKTD